MIAAADITVKIHFSDLESGVDSFVGGLIEKVSNHFGMHGRADDGDTCQIIVERSAELPPAPPPTTVMTYTVNENGRYSARVT